MDGKAQGSACRRKRGRHRMASAACWRMGRVIKPRAKRGKRRAMPSACAEPPAFRQKTGKHEARPVAGSGKGSTPACVKSSIPHGSKANSPRSDRRRPLVRAEFSHCYRMAGWREAPGLPQRAASRPVCCRMSKAVGIPAPNARSGGRCTPACAKSPSMQCSANFPQ